ncbi:hypothetical protein ACQP2P_22770 [Dactylosporangium sp. CA-139114]|uniref:hypothetical protein n=1 Tax=Dactylosporangium sp. CA-139114 TaxID=3239931 RepID=UPI003D961554
MRQFRMDHSRDRGADPRAQATPSMGGTEATTSRLVGAVRQLVAATPGLRCGPAAGMVVPDAAGTKLDTVPVAA